MYDDAQEQLRGVNRFNPNNMPLWEDYLDAQIEENRYDAPALLTFMKLYQLNPDKYKPEIVAKILLKTLMALPKSDIVLAKCLIDQMKADLENPPLSDVMELGDLLESCQFKKVWVMLTAKPQVIEGVTGFTEAVREFVCHVVNITYQSIKKDMLISLLGNLTDNELNEIIKKQGWELKPDGYVNTANPESKVKTKNIQEKVEFQDIRDILRATA